MRIPSFIVDCSVPLGVVEVLDPDVLPLIVDQHGCPVIAARRHVSRAMLQPSSRMRRCGGGGRIVVLAHEQLLADDGASKPHVALVRACAWWAADAEHPHTLAHMPAAAAALSPHCRIAHSRRLDELDQYQLVVGVV